ncbi:MAG TPA: hypothetical protein VG097_08030 [Gemmata sp.]|jgi:hypothetical protein|nr:hypothetical protein [Gemmata sp.]
MTNVTPEDLYRKALESEGGESVSAGARVAHVRSAIESGRTLFVNLSAVPSENRPALIAEINELIKRAEIAPQPSKDTSKTDVPGSAS